MTSLLNSLFWLQASPNDGLPPIVCIKCREQLDSCHRFRRVAHQTHQALHDYLQFTSKLNGTPQVSFLFHLRGKVCLNTWGLAFSARYIGSTWTVVECLKSATKRKKKINNVNKKDLQSMHFCIQINSREAFKSFQCKQFVCLLCNWIVTKITTQSR